MSFEFRISSFGLALSRVVRDTAGIFRRTSEGILRIFRSDQATDREIGAGAPERFANHQPETRDMKPETFFDTDFLRKLERLHLIAKRLSWAGAKGEHAASRKGFSLEFSDYRRYQRGDDLRYVDWNVYRRLERLLLKVFTAEEEMNIYLLVDTSRSMAEGTPEKIDYAKKVAAALGYIGLKNLDRVGGASFSSRLHAPLTLGRGRKQILNMFRFLGHLGCAHETNLRAAIHAFTNLFPHPGFVVIVSDLFDPAGWRGALEELIAKRYQLLVIHIVDEQELHPKPWGDIALVDVEGGRERKFFLDADLVRRFETELSGYFKEIEAVCASRRIDYLRTSTQVPFDEFVLQTLRQVSSVA
ncbi:MAG TPA: DUF58 domain-containing protein [Candidatus Binatia bacterium]|nr:DUF58 domain-containing protein [Candidatus Binatia bacterium]